MCFSAPASFVAGGGLAVLGVASWKLAKKKERLIAAVPFLFAVQQIAEGFQWLALESTGVPNELFGYAFMFFAFLFWPIYIPFIVYNFDVKNRNVGRWFLLSGTIIVLTLLWTMSSSPLVIGVANKCITYSVKSIFPPIFAVFYLMTVSGSMLVSKIHEIKFFGIASLLFALFTFEMYRSNYVSVWCFFAAILSGLVYLYLRKLRGL